jgi:hypothetical protein
MILIVHYYVRHAAQTRKASPTASQNFSFGNLKQNLSAKISIPPAE